MYSLSICEGRFASSSGGFPATQTHSTGDRRHLAGRSPGRPPPARGASRDHHDAPRGQSRPCLGPRTNRSPARSTPTCLSGLQPIGHPICRTGITSGVQCGQVTIVTYVQAINSDGNTVSLSGQNRASTCALPGDSGGPYIFNGVGFGMNSAAMYYVDAGGRPYCPPEGPDRYSTYSPLAETESDFGVQVRRSMP